MAEINVAPFSSIRPDRSGGFDVVLLRIFDKEQYVTADGAIVMAGSFRRSWYDEYVCPVEDGDVSIPEVILESTDDGTPNTGRKTAVFCSPSGRLLSVFLEDFVVYASEVAPTWPEIFLYQTTPPVPPDETAPAVPTGLAVTVLGKTSLRPNWSAATDNVAVTGYELSIDGGAAIDVGNVLTVDRTGLTPGTGYSFRVRAYDAAGNRSAYSGAVVGTTDAPVPPPEGFAIIDEGEGFIQVDWDV